MEREADDRERGVFDADVERCDLSRTSPVRDDAVDRDDEDVARDDEELVREDPDDAGRCARVARGASVTLRFTEPHPLQT